MTWTAHRFTYDNLPHQRELEGRDILQAMQDETPARIYTIMTATKAYGRRVAGWALVCGGTIYHDSTPQAHENLVAMKRRLE